MKILSLSKYFDSIIIILRLTQRSCLKPYIFRRILTSVDTVNMATAADETFNTDGKVALITKNLKVLWWVVNLELEIGFCDIEKVVRIGF